MNYVKDVKEGKVYIEKSCSIHKYKADTNKVKLVKLRQASSSAQVTFITLLENILFYNYEKVCAIVNQTFIVFSVVRIFIFKL